MRSNETHNSHVSVDPRLEAEYIKTHLSPNKEAWPFDEPFPLDVGLAKYCNDYPVTEKPKRPE